MTDTLAEVDRLTQSAQLAKPQPVRDRWGRYKRDPGGQWDWFYELDPAEREYISRRHMGGTLGPDELATWLDTNIDSAMAQWLVAVRVARGRITDPFDEDYDDAWREDFVMYDDEMADLVGYEEIGRLLGVKPNTVAQWRKRGLMPETLAIVSGTPIWKRKAIEKWATRTGKTIVEPSEV